MKGFALKLIQNPYLFLAGLLLISLLLYLPVLNIGYISDDWGFVYQIEHYGWSAFTHNFTDKFYIPISHFLGAVQYALTGGNPFYQHIFQVLIHGIVAFQIFKLLSDISIKTNRKELIPIGMIASVLFLINPFQVESVAWLASKSYGYTLLFSLLALRVLFNDLTTIKKQTLFWSLTFVAIHSKEWAYMLPFIAFCMMKISSLKIDKQFWIGGIITITLSLIIRFLALGTFVGGYENSESFDIMVVSTHLVAYFIKFLTYLRFASTAVLPVPIVGILSLIFFISLIRVAIKSNVKTKNILYFFAIIILTLLPIAGLEMTSFFSNQSDRYSYFALVPFSIIYAFVFYHLKNWTRILSIAMLSLTFIYFSYSYNQKWHQSSEIAYDFLESLSSEVDKDSRVLLYNVPDSYNDIYCVRNGIEPYLKVQGKIVDIEVFQRQDFHKSTGGSTFTKDSIFGKSYAMNTYTTFPKDSISFEQISFDWNWVSEFDATFIYLNKEFKRLD